VLKSVGVVSFKTVLVVAFVCNIVRLYTMKKDMHLSFSLYLPISPFLSPLFLSLSLSKGLDKVVLLIKTTPIFVKIDAARS